MLDLQTAAAKFDVHLQGVRLDRRSLPLRQPAIAHLKIDGAGHFIVLRPVGSTGTMVQVIEPFHAPRIVDYVDLTRGAAWTGDVLLFDSPADRLWRCFSWMFVLLLLSIGIFIIMQAQRSRIQEATPDPGGRPSRRPNADDRQESIPG